LATLMEKDILLEASAELIAKTYKNGDLYQEEAIKLWDEVFYTEFGELHYLKTLNSIKNLSYKLNSDEDEISEDEIFRRILDTELKLKNPSLTPEELPKGYVLGGQPGAGKAFLLRQIAMMNDKNIVIINAGDYRKYHPKYYEYLKIYGKEADKFTAEFSSKMAERVIDEVVKRRLNIVVEGTFTTYKTPLKILKMLKENSYKTSALIITAEPEISYKACMERYEKAIKDDPKNAKFVEKEHHDLVVQNLYENIDRIKELEYIDICKVLKRDEDGKIIKES